MVPFESRAPVSAAAHRKPARVFQKLTLPHRLYYSVRLFVQRRVTCWLALKVELVLGQEGPGVLCQAVQHVSVLLSWLILQGKQMSGFLGQEGRMGSHVLFHHVWL